MISTNQMVCGIETPQLKGSYRFKTFHVQRAPVSLASFPRIGPSHPRVRPKSRDCSRWLRFNSKSQVSFGLRGASRIRAVSRNEGNKHQGGGLCKIPPPAGFAMRQAPFFAHKRGATKEGKVDMHVPFAPTFPKLPELPEHVSEEIGPPIGAPLICWTRSD